MSSRPPGSGIPRWLLAAAAVGLLLSAVRLGWRAYCFHVVDAQARASPWGRLGVERPGSERFLRMLGRPGKYLFGRPRTVRIEFDESHSRGTIAHFVWCLSQLEGISTLWLGGPGLEDQDLLQLVNLESIRSLSLVETRVTGRGLELLKALPKLESLDLHNSAAIDDGALEIIAESSGLVSLCLGGTQITDAGLSRLAELTALEELLLDDTQITDAGLEELRHLQSLRRLSVSQTGVTDAGVDALCRWLPELEVTDD